MLLLIYVFIFDKPPSLPLFYLLHSIHYLQPTLANVRYEEDKIVNLRTISITSSYKGFPRVEPSSSQQSSKLPEEKT
ncbi:unnamed protein product [Citrullus colocynthis]|uniref:Uncharacterized protein n=1 Tax=Citrullus colocynthis TaxID=252529 RepID=A0ABP0YHK8_9ROSI